MAVRVRCMRNKSESERRFWCDVGVKKRVRGVRCGLSGQLAEGKQAASPFSRRVTVSRCRNGVSAAEKDAVRSGDAAVSPGCVARPHPIHAALR